MGTIPSAFRSGFRRIAAQVTHFTGTVRLARGYSPERAIRFFTMSNTYLALLFAAIAVDTIVQSH